jgi:hypothetical protein
VSWWADDDDTLAEGIEEDGGDGKGGAGKEAARAPDGKAGKK